MAGGALGASLGLSFLVASCCLAPSLFLLFGVSVTALGAFTALAPYQGYLVAAGLGSLGVAGYRIFAGSADEEACADPACAPGGPQRRRLRQLFFAAAGIFTIAALYPYVLDALL